MHILHVVGARLNFVKAAPVMRALERWPDVRQTLRSFDRTIPRLLDSGLTRILEGGAKNGSIPPLWDGRASERIAQALREYLAP